MKKYIILTALCLALSAGSANSAEIVGGDHGTEILRECTNDRCFFSIHNLTNTAIYVRVRTTECTNCISGLPERAVRINPGSTEIVGSCAQNLSGAWSCHFQYNWNQTPD